MKSFISHRAKLIKPSPTLAVYSKAKEMIAKNIDVVNFGVGEPDFYTPDYIKEEAKKAISDNFTHYTNAAGILELREAIVNKLIRDNNINYHAENILVAPGAKAALFNILLTLCNPGDEVLIPAPYWVSYTSQVELLEAIPILLYASVENDFKITANQIEEMIKALNKPRFLIINSPNNPTGVVYKKDELEQIGEVCLKHNIIMISDEIYEKIIYDQAEHISIASISDKLKNNSIIINGVSKAYAMTGWRLGYAAGHEEIIRTASRIQSHSVSCVNSITQKAAVKALNINDGSIEQMRYQFEKRRNFFVKALNDLNHVHCLKPQGAFYIFTDISFYLNNNKKGIKNSIELCEYLLKDYLVALVPGTAFGAEGFVRFSFANSIERIKKGLKRFKEGLSSLI